MITINSNKNLYTNYTIPNMSAYKNNNNYSNNNYNNNNIMND